MDNVEFKILSLFTLLLSDSKVNQKEKGDLAPSTIAPPQFLLPSNSGTVPNGTVPKYPCEHCLKCDKCIPRVEIYDW